MKRSVFIHIYRLSVFILSEARFLLAYYVAEDWIQGLAHGPQAELCASHIA